MYSQSYRYNFSFLVLCMVGLFIVFIWMDDNPNIRSQRACYPIFWTAQLTYSTISLFDQRQAQLIQDHFKPAYKTCVMSSWALFYGKKTYPGHKRFS